MIMGTFIFSTVGVYVTSRRSSMFTRCYLSNLDMKILQYDLGLGKSLNRLTEKLHGLRCPSLVAIAKTMKMTLVNDN